MSTNKYVGRDYPIHDAWQKVSGEMVYTGDMKLPLMYYGKMIYSAIPFGCVKHIDTKRAEALDGVIGVFTYANTPDRKYNNYFSYVGQQGVSDERLFTDVVRFVGDKIGAVVATSPEIAEEAISLIDIEYEEYKPMVDIYQSLKNEGKTLHEGGNILNDGTLKAGDAHSILEKSERVYETYVHIPRIHHAAMEKHVCLASYNALGEITIWTPCQGAFGVRNAVATYLDMNYSDIHVIKTTTGGSFGGKQQMLLEIITAYLAKEVGGAVLLEYDRRGSILSTSVGTSFDITVKSDVSEDGVVDAIEYEAIADAGAYATNSQALPMSAGKKVSRLYKVKDTTYHCRSVYTNAPVAGGLRGWGGPQLYTALEIHMDHLAKECSLNPMEIRLKNMVEPGDKDPYAGISLGNVHVKECLTRGGEVFGWDEKYRADKGAGRFRRGVGLACGAHMNGYYNGVHDISNMTLKMNEDGTFILNTAVHEQGCGTLISLSVIVAEVLGVPVEKVKVKEVDTDTSPYDMGTYSSRVTYVSGKCAEKAARHVKDLILHYGAQLLDEEKENVFIENEYVVNKAGDKKLSFREVATRTQTEKQFDIMVLEHHINESNPGSYGAHFAEVEVDTLTGLIRVTDYLAAHDLGRALNLTMVEGQLQGAVQAGIGCALTEEVGLDSKGYPTVDNFDKYTVINLPDMPIVRTLVLEYGGDEGPFEGKSIGEAALVPVAAAVVNAVNNALGTELTNLPLTPKKIVEALYGKGGK